MCKRKKVAGVLLACSLAASLMACAGQTETDQSVGGVTKEEAGDQENRETLGETEAETKPVETTEEAETEIILRCTGKEGAWGVPCLITVDNKGVMVITPGENAEYTDEYDDKGLTAVVIEEGITLIGQTRFYSCPELVTVTLPNSMTEIREGAFEDCDRLKEVTIPDSVTVMGKGVFQMCDGLVSVMIPDSVAEFGKAMFTSCDSLEEVTLPSGLTEIPFGTFGFCTSLKSLEIPAGVTKIGDEAFMGCEALTDIYFGGTEEQWQSIKIGEYNEVLDTVTVHFGADSE